MRGMGSLRAGSTPALFGAESIRGVKPQLYCRALASGQIAEKTSFLKLRDGKSMIQVLQIPFPKDKLRAISTEERVALLLFGHVANQIAIMEKLLTFATNFESADQLEQRAEGLQIEMILRLMVGLLNEAQRAIQTRFNSSPLAKTYRDLLDEGGQNALADLNLQFSQSIIQKLRTKFAFHHPSSDDIEKAFDLAVGDPGMDSEWNWYLSQHAFNSLFYFSDVVITHAVFEEIGEADWHKGQQKLMKEVTRAANNIKEFVLSFVKAVWLKHFGAELLANRVFEINDAPNATSVRMPFFVTVPGLPPIRDGMLFR